MEESKGSGYFKQVRENELHVGKQKPKNALGHSRYPTARILQLRAYVSEVKKLNLEFQGPIFPCVLHRIGKQACLLNAILRTVISGAWETSVQRKPTKEARFPVVQEHSRSSASHTLSS